jgi:hypothetical protein
MPDTSTQVVKVQLPDGHSVALEVTQLGASTQVDQRVANLPPSFEDLTNSLASMSKAIYGAIQTIAPKKASVEFGIEIAAEAGKLTALLVKGTGKANLKVTLEWG